MKNLVKIFKTIRPYNKSIQIDGDKSLSIRWALLASQAKGKSKSSNLLRSEDVLNTLECLKKLGVKIKLSKNYCVIYGKGLNKFKYEKKITLDAGNSGTLGRLLMGLLVHSKSLIKIKGDKSLSKRDFNRVIIPLKKFGAKFKSNSGKRPIEIYGTKNPTPIKFKENIGSAQIKSSILLAALNTKGKTIIKAAKSRNHTELIYKFLNIPIKIKKIKNNEIIEVNGLKKIKPLNYKIPSDISSSAFFITLTALAKNSKLNIKNVNVNPTRTGILKILKLMGIQVKMMNIKSYKGEKIADLFIESKENIRPINCPTNLNSSAIDEFLLIFLIAAKADGISFFKGLSELNQKESPRLLWGSKILNKMGVKNILTKNSLKIYGNPKLKIEKKIIIKNFLKDHRVFMTSVIAALTFGGVWEIGDKNAINTSFPSFLRKIKSLGAKVQ